MATMRGGMKGGTSKITPAKFGRSGGLNSLLSMMAAQSMLAPKQQIMASSDLAKQGAAIANAPEQVQGIMSRLPGGAPPGSEITREGIKIPINREMTVEETKAMSGAEAVSRHIDYIRQAQKDPDFRSQFTKATFRIGGGGNKGQVAGFPTSFGDSKAMMLNYAIEDLSNRLLYLRSGAQINEKEFERLSRTLPSWSDISDPNDTNYAVLNYKLNAFEQDLMNIRNRIMLGGNYDVNYWEAPVPSAISATQAGSSTSPIPGMNQGNQQLQGSVRDQYNALRRQGVDAETAKRRLGL